MSRPLKDRRVLIVEDQYLIADEMRRSVQALGGEVLGPAPSVEGARAWLEKGGVDLALLDINLSGEEVFPLADDLALAGIPFIFATGYDEILMPDRYRGALCLQKPVSRTALEGLLKKAKALG